MHVLHMWNACTCLMCILWHWYYAHVGSEDCGFPPKPCIIVFGDVMYPLHAQVLVIQYSQLEIKWSQ